MVSNKPEDWHTQHNFRIQQSLISDYCR